MRIDESTRNNWVRQLSQCKCVTLYKMIDKWCLIYEIQLYFCVACVAWQTHRDHVVRPHRRRRRRPTSSSSSSHFSFPFNNFWRDVMISFKFCRTLYHYKIQVKFDIGNHPPNFGWVMALFRLSFCCSFPPNNFWRDAFISFKLCRTLYYCKIQVKFDIGNHAPNFGCYGHFST